jgi:hypothetical protein
MPEAEFEAGGWPMLASEMAPSSRAADIVPLGLCLSRGQHVSNAADGAKDDKRDNDPPCDLKGAAKRNGWGGCGAGKGSNGVIGRAGLVVRSSLTAVVTSSMSSKLGECAIQQLRG